MFDHKDKQYIQITSSKGFNVLSALVRLQYGPVRRLTTSEQKGIKTRLHIGRNIDN